MHQHAINMEPEENQAMNPKATEKDIGVVKSAGWRIKATARQTGVILAAILLVGIPQLSVQADSTFTDIVTVAHPDSATTVWRIGSPNVRQATTAYPQIRFHPGDAITITAGGCVGTGQTWKSYVQPLGKDAGRYYSGTIMIAGVIPAGAEGYQRIAGWISTANAPKTLMVPEHLPPTVRESDLFLHLGYQDDKYSDNGYSNHSNGDPPQCVNTGAAWVEIRIVSGKLLARESIHRLSFGPEYSVHAKPFDLVWDMKAGVDGNGLPLNPIWAYQIDHPGQEPDFRGICQSAFPDAHTLNPGILASVCTTQSPSTDFAHAVSVCDVKGPFNTQQLFAGHLNWALATYAGRLYWDEDSTDGDFNFDLLRPDRAGLTTLNSDPKNAMYDGLHLEFNERETIANFRSPFWVDFRSNDGKHGSDALFSKAVNGRFAVITGLHGIDGVHGGHSESHPVFAMAIQLSSHLPAQGELEESWAIFLRNRGGEGQCSRMQHDWYGLSDGSIGRNWYFLQLPWPAGAVDASIVAGPTEIWVNDSRVRGPFITRDPNWLYLGFQMPGPDSGPELDGQITVRYRLAPGAHMPEPAVLHVQPLSSSNDSADGWEEIERRIANPAARTDFQQKIRSTDMAVVHPRPHTTRLIIGSGIGIHQPLRGPAHEGRLVPDRANLDAAIDRARQEHEQRILGTLPPNILPAQAAPQNTRPR